MAGLQHSLALNKDLNQRARERFTSSMRAWVLTDLAAQMQVLSFPYIIIANSQSR